MHKIILDTNVLVSALLTKGYPSKILSKLVLEQKVILCLSEAIWWEYIDVLHRDKFAKYPTFLTQAEIVLSRIEDIALKFQPDVTFRVLSDEADNKFLEVAVFAHADFLITGNTNDFIYPVYQAVKIITPREYWETFR